MRRIVSLWLPDLSTNRLERDDPGLAARPLVTVFDQAGRPIIRGVNAAASIAGLAPGMALATARSLSPDLVVRRADFRADRAFHDRLIRWAGRYSPLVARDSSDGILIDITGCDHLLGGEGNLLQDMADRLNRLGISHRIALADTRLAARAIARSGETAEGPILVPPGEQRAALAPLPVYALEIDPVLVSDLSKVGLKRIGDLTAMPRASLARRYGLSVCARLDRALGDEPDSINASKPPTPYRVRLRFPDAISTPDDIARALDRLMQRLTERLEAEQQGARKLVLETFRVDGNTHRLTVGTATPSRRAAHLTRLFNEKLPGIDPGFGIEMMVLSAPVTEVSLPVQQSAETGTDRKDSSSGLSDLVDRLAARLGPERVLNLRPVNSHLPDRATRFSHASENPRRAVEWIGHLQACLGPRPLRLLDRPEPVTPLTCPPPGHALRSFRWRGRRLTVARALGPERISPEWWCIEPVGGGNAWTGPRDYYAVEEGTGTRLWMFSEGQTAKGSAITAPRWFVHGLFD